MQNAILFQPTGEVRRAKSGEWIFDGDVFVQVMNVKTIYKYPIYTRHEIPEELEDRINEHTKEAK